MSAYKKPVHPRKDPPATSGGGKPGPIARILDGWSEILHMIAGRASTL